MSHPAPKCHSARPSPVLVPCPCPEASTQHTDHTYHAAYRWGASGRCCSRQQLVEKRKKGKKEGKKGKREVSVGMLSADRTQVLQEMPPTPRFHHTTTSGSTHLMGARHRASDRQAAGWAAGVRSWGCPQRRCARGHAVNTPASACTTSPGSGTARSHRLLLQLLRVPAPGTTACELPGAKLHQPKPLSTAEREKSEPGGKATGAWRRELQPLCGGQAAEQGQGHP